MVKPVYYHSGNFELQKYISALFKRFVILLFHTDIQFQIWLAYLFLTPPTTPTPQKNQNKTNKSIKNNNTLKCDTS